MSFFAHGDRSEPSRPHFRVYLRVQEVMTATCERAAALSRKMEPLSAVLPKKNRKLSVADVPEFSNGPPVNPDFSCLTDNTTVSNKRWDSITFLEMDRMETVSRSLLEGILHSLWLMILQTQPCLTPLFIYFRFIVLASSGSCYFRGFSPVEAKGELRRSFYFTSLPGSEA